MPLKVFIYSKVTKNVVHVVPRDVTHVTVDPSVKEIHDKAFEEFWFLVEVEFSEGLERIGIEAFYSCQNLKNINKLPSTLKEIDDSAFRGCRKLGDSIDFPERLQAIGIHAFEGCRNLKRIKIPSAQVVIKRCAFAYCISLSSVDLPEGLQVIGESWFLACKSLTTVNVPSSVIEIQRGAFRGCTSLASLDLPEGLQSIGDRSFEGCKSLESLHIPSTVCKIGTGVFSECTGLKHMHIPSSVASIGARAFQGCIQLLWVHLLGNLHTIEDLTFRGCTSLTHLRLPSSVTRIERAAFAYCTRLISLELPEGLQKIDLDLGHYDDYYARPNIYECRSLVNLVIPLEQHVERIDDDAEFMENLELRHVASNFDDLVIKLQHRFDTLPVHRLCYYQSYYPLTETMENLRTSIDADPSAVRKVDYFGMTPFHILALSQTPNLSLFQALLKLYKVDIIRTRDKFGSVPIDYLCLNHAPDSATLIKSLIVQRIQWLGLAQWKADMLAALDGALAVDSWLSRQREMGLLYFKLATYERLEAISMLELALWKVKIDERKPVQNKEHLDDEGSLKKLRLVESDLSQEEGADRQSCRINSGVEVVISNVLPFLGKVCREDYCVAD